MSDPIPLTDTVLLVICPSCEHRGCERCKGTGRVAYDPYSFGEQSDDFADLRREAVSPLEQALLELVELKAVGR